ncbi:MAG: UPF0323 family lipoprotein [Campylobacterota bacterium]|nr:UPF0323 family lipoprotein [Campylobacterota bacterium]
MKYLRKLSDYALVSGVGALLATGLTGCQDNTAETAPQAEATAKGAFVIIEETTAGKYVIKDEFPSEETRIVLKTLDGTEKVLTKEELDALMQEENAKIDNGTSELTKPREEQVSSQGMGLGETILASAAGAMLGAWIGSKLFGNSNYQNNRKASYKSPSTYSKSNKSFNKSGSSGTSGKSGKSGYFGGKSASNGG